MMSYLVFIVGTTIAIRIIMQICYNIQVTQQVERSILIFSLVLSGILTLLLMHKPTVLWLSFGIFLLTLKLFDKNFLLFLDYFFKKKQIMLVEQLSLSVRSGKSLRSAMKELVDQHQGWMRFQLRQILSVIEHETKSEEHMKCRSVAEFMASIVKIERKKNQQIEALNFYRSHLKNCENFRRRSGKIRSQAYGQSAVMSLLFVLISIFGIFQFGWSAMQTILPFAVTFFVVGVVLMLVIGRKIKWKL